MKAVISYHIDNHLVRRLSQPGSFFTQKQAEQEGRDARSLKIKINTMMMMMRRRRTMTMTKAMLMNISLKQGGENIKRKVNCDDSTLARK